MFKFLIIAGSCFLLLWRVWAQDSPENVPEPMVDISEISIQEPGVHEVFEPLTDGRLSRVVRVGKTLNIPEGTSIQSAVVVFGDVLLQGNVRGNLWVVQGSVTFGQGAHVGGNLVLLMSDAAVEQGQIDGEIRQLQSGSLFSGTISLLTGPPRREKDAGSQLIYVLTGYRVSWGNIWLLWRVVSFLFVILTHLFLVLLFPWNMENMIRRFTGRPLGSVILGLGVALLLLPISLLCLFSPISFLILLSLMMILVLLAIFGKTAILLTLGNVILQQNHANGLAVLVGYLVYSLATALPYLGLPIFLVINFLSVGLCLRSHLGTSPVRVRGTHRPMEHEVKTGWDSPVRGS